MRTIQQRVEFPGATPAELYDLYVDPAKHAAAIDAPVTMRAAAGGEFKAFGDDHVRGTILALVPTLLVLQTWRARIWQPSEPDSVLVLAFTAIDRGARIDLVQAGVPERVRDIIDGGWTEKYWEKWRAYLDEAR